MLRSLLARHLSRPGLAALALSAALFGGAVPASAQDAADLLVRTTRLENQLRQMSGQIEQLQYAWSAVSSVYDQAALDTDIADALAQLSRYLALRDMNSVSDLSPELKGLILRRTGSGADSGALQSRISALQAELDTL